jgi:hypothetical protein
MDLKLNTWPTLLLPAILGLAASDNVPAIESVHFGVSLANAAMTDAIRLSARTGTNWWSLNSNQLNPENGTAIPYAYHDGYVEWVGASKTAADEAARWFKILHGQGDPWTGASPATVGSPKIILLDEITTAFTDSGQGPALQEALRLYTTIYGGSTNDIIAYASRSVSITPNNNTYASLVYSVNHYLRCLALELYASQEGFITGYERDQPGVYRGTNDTYLIGRWIFPVHRWITNGMPAGKLMPILAVSNYADSNGTSNKPGYKFLNRYFWLLANGWYAPDHVAVSAGLQTILRNGVGTYTWAPGTDSWSLVPTEVQLDSHIEAYLKWYCVDGHLDPHPDGVDAGPNQAPVLAAISNRTVTAGALLTFTSSASDADFPPNALAFSLDPGAPVGATVEASSGRFSWTAPQTALPTTNSITVRVTDNGSPPLSDARSFTVVMLPPPRFSGITVTTGRVVLSWQTYPGRTYRVQYQRDLWDSNWTTLGSDRIAASSSLGASDSVGASLQRFYRVLQVN